MNRAQFDQQFARFMQDSGVDGRFHPRLEDLYPILDEDTPTTAIHYSFGYLMHCGWAARVLAASRPARHVDIGSYVYFAGLCSAFVPMSFYDIRTIFAPLPNLECGAANLTGLPFPDNSIPSLSCLHTLEHVGLARYGDALDVCGDRKAARELSRVLAPGGQLLIVVPVNQVPRVVFNAHRHYSYQYVLDLFAGLTVKEFTLINGSGLISNASPSQMTNVPLQEDVGCFVFTK